MIVCWAAFTARLDCMQPTGHKLDSPALLFTVFQALWEIQTWPFHSKKSSEGTQFMVGIFKLLLNKNGYFVFVK